MGKKITGLVELDATPDDADILPIVDDVSGTPVTKKVTVANLKASSFPVSDTTAIVKGSTDPSKLLRIEVDGFTAETERVLTPQDKDYTLAEAGANSSITEISGLTTLLTLAQGGIGPLGAADLKLFVNAAGNLGEWASGMKIGTFTRVMNAANGDVAYTGVGFKPSHIIFLISVVAEDSWSIGFDDGTLTYSMADRGVGTRMNVIPTASIYYNDSGGSEDAFVKTWDSDGFTLTWAKAGGAIALTGTIFYMAFR